MGGKLLLSTRFETVLSNRPCDVRTLQPFNHSEADTRILLPLAHAAEHGHTKAYVRTVDSDVVVLAVLSRLAYQSFGWALVQENIIVTFQYIPSALI